MITFNETLLPQSRIPKGLSCSEPVGTTGVESTNFYVHRNSNTLLCFSLQVEHDNKARPCANAVVATAVVDYYQMWTASIALPHESFRVDSSMY